MDYRTARFVLGTKPTSTYTQIKSAYRQRALALHPDHNKSSGAPARFSTLVRAYQFLMNFRSPFQAERYKRKGNQRGRGLVRLVVLLGVSSFSLSAATDLRVTAPVAALQCDIETTGTVQLAPGLTTKQLSSNRLPSGKLRILVYGLNQLTIPAGNFAVVDAPVTSVGGVVTANVNGTLSTATILVGSLPPPPPPPPPASESPSGTTIPPASQITDAGGAVWTVGANLYGRGPIPIRNSVSVAGGTWGCSKVLYQSSVVYCYGAQGWIRWTGTAWITGSPSSPPPPPPPPPASPGPAITLTSLATRTLSLTRRTDNTSTSVPLTVNKDDCVRFNGAKVAGGLNCP